jgi:hypothetical protein
MSSGLICRASALLLLAAGFALLFAADGVLPGLSAAAPGAASWPGQLLGSAWVGLGVLNWWNRSALLGGIYGRPFVAANFAFYVATALVLLRGASRAASPAGLWPAGAVAALLAAGYGVLLFRGPLERDRRAHGGN